MSWPSIRSFLDIPDALTGRRIGIAVLDGTFARHPDIADGGGRRVRLVETGRPGARPVPVLADWPAGCHGLWSAAAAGGSGSASAGVYRGAAPEADLWLLAAHVPGEEVSVQEQQLRSLRWLRDHWRDHGIRGAATAIAGSAGSGLLPWQAEPLRVACEELADAGLLVVAGTGNTPDATARVTQAAAPSVLAVGGVTLPAGGGWRDAPPYHGCRGATFEGKWSPEVLAPAENLVMPFLPGPDYDQHAGAGIDDVPAGCARVEGTSYAGPIVLGAAACLWQAHPTWTAVEVRTALVATARRRRAWSTLRAGLIDVAAAAGWRGAGPPPSGRPSPYERYAGWRAGPSSARMTAARSGETGEAVEALLSCLPDQVTDQVAALAADLLSRSPGRLRAAALCVLAARPDRLDAALLRPHLRDGDVLVRAAALHALRSAPHAWNALADAVEARLGDADPDVVQAAAALAEAMGETRLVRALVDGLAEDVRLRRPSCYHGRLRALERLTGASFPPRHEWRLGEPLYDDRFWRERAGVAGEWRRWLTGGGR